MKHRCNEIEANLEKFKSQYSKNSKEVLKLAMSVSELAQEVREHKNISIEKGEENKKFHEDLKPILDSYQALVGGRKIFLGAVITLSAVGSLYLIIKNIFYGK